MSGAMDVTRQKGQNVDDTQREPIRPKIKLSNPKVNTRVISRKNLGVSTNSIKKFRYLFGGK